MHPATLQNVTTCITHMARNPDHTAILTGAECRYLFNELSGTVFCNGTLRIIFKETTPDGFNRVFTRSLS